MKKVLLFLLILMLGFGGYLFYNYKFNDKIPVLEIEEMVGEINKLTIYGTHLNLSGKIDTSEELDLVLYNGEFMSYKIKIITEWKDSLKTVTGEIKNRIDNMWDALAAGGPDRRALGLSAAEQSFRDVPQARRHDADGVSEYAQGDRRRLKTRLAPAGQGNGFDMKGYE